MGDFFAVGGLYLPYACLPELATSNGFSVDQASLVITLLGTGSFAGRLASIFFYQRTTESLNLLNLILLTSVTSLLLPAFSVLVLDSPDLTALLVIFFMFGLGTGVWVAATSPFVISLLGTCHFDTAIGLLTFSRGAPATCFPFLMSALAEKMHKPFVPLFASSILFFLAMVTFFAGLWQLEKEKTAPRTAGDSSEGDGHDI